MMCLIGGGLLVLKSLHKQSTHTYQLTEQKEHIHFLLLEMTYHATASSVVITDITICFSSLFSWSEMDCKHLSADRFLHN